MSSATSLGRATSLQNYLKVQPHIHNRVEPPAARSAKCIAHTGPGMGTQIDSARQDLRPAINGYGTDRITRAASPVSPEAQIKGRIPKAGRHAVTGHRYAQPVTVLSRNPKMTVVHARGDSPRRSCHAHRERTVAPRSELNRHVRAQTRKLQQVGRNGHALSRCLPGKKKAGKAQEHYRFHYAIHSKKSLLFDNKRRWQLRSPSSFVKNLSKLDTNFKLYKFTWQNLQYVRNTPPQLTVRNFTIPEEILRSPIDLLVKLSIFADYLKFVNHKIHPYTLYV